MFTDHIAGSDVDSGLTMEIECDTCGERHRIALSRIGGRSAFSCKSVKKYNGRRKTFFHSGTFEGDWTATLSEARRIIAERAKESPCPKSSD